MVSETLTLLSVFSAFLVFLDRSVILTRFAFAFLGLFSSLVVYLNGGIAIGLTLLLTSCILLPYPLSQLLGKNEKRRKSPRPGMLILASCLVVIFVAGILVPLGAVDTGLAMLTSVGIAALAAGISPRDRALGLILVSQAILTALSLRNVSFGLFLCLELFRLSYITYASLASRRINSRALLALH